jgi:hypothetical protein
MDIPTQLCLEILSRVKHILVGSTDVLMIISTSPRREKNIGFDPTFARKSYVCHVESPQRRITFVLPRMRFQFRDVGDLQGLLHSIAYVGGRVIGTAKVRLGDIVVSYWARILFNSVIELDRLNENSNDSNPSSDWTVLYRDCHMIQCKIETSILRKCYRSGTVHTQCKTLEVDPEWLQAPALLEYAKVTINSYAEMTERVKIAGYDVRVI